MLDIQDIIEKAGENGFITDIALDKIEEEKKKKEEAVKTPKLPDNYNGYNILYIDDQQFYLNIFKEFLEERGFLTFLAKSGEEGLKIAQTEKINLIMIDIFMPGLNGYDLLEKLMADERTKNTPIMFITQYGTADGAKKARDMGAKGYFQKQNLIKINNPMNWAAIIRKAEVDEAFNTTHPKS